MEPHAVEEQRNHGHAEGDPMRESIEHSGHSVQLTTFVHRLTHSSMGLVGVQAT
jgi:hypothetical protein